MKTKMRLISFLLCIVMLVSFLPASVLAYGDELTAEGNAELETIICNYTQPIGVTMKRLTGNCKSEIENLGDDFLFVIKSGDRYYAMKDIAASEEAYEAIPAVDVTAWVNTDGTLTVPADTLDVAFWRYETRSDYEYGLFINGREDYLAYSYDWESADGDDDYYNDAERTYWGNFIISTFEDGEYIESDPYYWSENGTSGTLQFNGSWTYKISSYNYRYLKYNVIADLRSDGNGGQEFYFRYLGSDVEYVGDEVEGYLYYADCRHQHTIRHAEYDAPTCMLKGCEEYWYCEGCDEYFKDEAMTQLWGEEMPIIPAIGHDWGSEKCANCNRPVPIYSKVTNQADFNALADDTMFILVSEYDGKYYVPDLGTLYLYMQDSDGDGFADIHNIDENENDIPDYFEFDDGGEEGIYDYLEWDMDSDGDVDKDDHLAFSEMICNQYLTDRLYNNSGISATEVVMNSDGTFSHAAAEATAEFEMVDLYLKEEIDSMIDFVKESESWWTDDMRYTYECVKQFVIPNMFISAPSMTPTERQYQQRISDLGDTYSWGVLFYNDASSYKVYNYETESVEQPKLNDVCTQDSVVVFDTFDYMWYDATWNRQLGQLRLRDYGGTISFVTGDDYMLEGSEYVEDPETGEGYYDTHDTQAAVYLYASQQASHTCEFKDWTDNEDGRTHTGTCTCGTTKVQNHNWNDWTELSTNSYKRTCVDCNGFQTMTLVQDTPVNTTPSSNAANTNLTNTNIELIDKVLTDEERSRVAEGAEVKVYLKVEDISEETPADHQAEAEAKAGDSEIGMYLDIDLFKQIGAESETPVTETASAVSVTITVPNNLLNTDPAVNRTYQVIRVHEEADGTLVSAIIEGTFNAEDNSFIFETDQFSTYALAYTDTPADPDDSQTDNEQITFTYEATGANGSASATVSELVTLKIYMSVSSTTAHIWGVNLDLQYDEHLTLLSVDGCILLSSFNTPLDTANATHTVMIAQDMGWGDDKAFENGNYLFATLTFQIGPACQAQSLVFNAIAETSMVDHKSANAIVADFGTGTTIPLGNAVMYGDATGDGVVDGMDVIRLKKYLAGYDYEAGTSSVEIAAGADATGDGVVDGMDVIRLKKYLAGYDYESGESTVPLGP